jgi:hypothetical protein
VQPCVSLCLDVLGAWGGLVGGCFGVVGFAGNITMKEQQAKAELRHTQQQDAKQGSVLARPRSSQSIHPSSSHSNKQATGRLAAAAELAHLP